MFEIKEIDVAYGNVQVLWGASSRVNEGEIVTIIGPNGAGKSTLLRTVLGLLKPMNTPKANSIIYKGERIDGLLPEQIVRLGISLVPEGRAIFPDMTVLDNLKMGSYIKDAREKREESLEMVFSLFPRLKERRGQMARTLSGGEAQMLAIGRSLMCRPDLLLIDEPSLGLAPSIVSKTYDAIRQIRERGVTILLVEQNVFFSLEISDRGYVLENGRIVMEEKGKELLANEYIKKAYLAV